MINLGKTARDLRQKLGLTQRAMSKKLGITDVHLCNVENCKSIPSSELLQRYRDLSGVDLYVLAWCQQGDIHRLPAQIRKAASALAAGWRRQIEAVVQKTRKDARCSESATRNI